MPAQPEGRRGGKETSSVQSLVFFTEARSFSGCLTMASIIMSCSAEEEFPVGRFLRIRVLRK
jgi:hypothetical protein